MRIAVQILAGVLVLLAAFVIHRAIGAGTGTKVIGVAMGTALIAGAGGMFALAWKHPALVAAGEQRGEPVMSLGKMVTSFGGLAVVWLYNLAVLAVLVVLTLRLL